MKVWAGSQLEKRYCGLWSEHSREMRGVAKRPCFSFHEATRNVLYFQVSKGSL